MAKQDELSLLRAHLRLALNSLGMAPRNIENELGIGHGTLSRLLDGRMELKLSHLLAFCKLLDIQNGIRLGRAKRRRRLPVVLTRDEVRSILSRLSGGSICPMRSQPNTRERRANGDGNTSSRRWSGPLIPRAAGSGATI